MRTRAARLIVPALVAAAIAAAQAGAPLAGRASLGSTAEPGMAAAPEPARAGAADPIKAASEPAASVPRAAEPTKAAATGTSAAATEPATAGPQEPEAKLVLSQWHSLYVGGKKIGYTAQNLYTLGNGGRRLQTNTFLKASLAADKFGYFKMITADVDAKFRPRALRCQVSTADRQWDVTGKVEQGELVLTRNLGGAAATSRIPIDDEVTFLSWALQATLLAAARAGETCRWLVIDESLGALVPDQCQVRVLGSRGRTGGPQALPPEATAVLWTHGADQVIHLVESGGRTVRSVWQTAPMVAEGTSFSEARRIAGAGPGMPGVEIDGLDANQYRNQRLGIVMSVPAYPCVTHVIPDVGVVLIRDLTDEASVVVRPASGPRPPAAGPLPDSEAARQADLIQREWAARFEDVKGGPIIARPADGGARAQVRSIEGTARLGCTTFNFRNLYLPGDGLAWLASETVADRPLSAKGALLDACVNSIKLSAPEGQLPVQLAGDVVRSPYYGFELRRPSKSWRIPTHVGGPMTVLEMAREDGAAVAIIRVAKLAAGQTLETFVAQQATIAAQNLGVPQPAPAATTLGGQAAVEISYQGAKILSGEPARCTTIFAQLDSRVLSLALVVRADADPTAAKDVQQMRDSLKLEKATASAAPGAF